MAAYVIPALSHQQLRFLRPLLFVSILYSMRQPGEVRCSSSEVRVERSIILCIYIQGDKQLGHAAAVQYAEILRVKKTEILWLLWSWTVDWFCPSDLLGACFLNYLPLRITQHQDLELAPTFTGLARLPGCRYCQLLMQKPMIVFFFLKISSCD